jgi:hypothetical protein
LRGDIHLSVNLHAADELEEGGFAEMNVVGRNVPPTHPLQVQVYEGGEMAGRVERGGFDVAEPRGDVGGVVEFEGPPARDRRNPINEASKPASKHPEESGPSIFESLGALPAPHRIERKHEVGDVEGVSGIASLRGERRLGRCTHRLLVWRRVCGGAKGIQRATAPPPCPECRRGSLGVGWEVGW